MSFVQDGSFAGACIVPAQSMLEAMIEAIHRGCHPCGVEVSAMELPATKPPAPADYVGRLLTEAQVVEFDQAWRRQVH
ncbi:MAG TPA: hypothetical protein VGC15_04135 [Acetobacteraceae bacterium]